MAKTTYSELLQDPRWQKKRLEILETANWMCEDCNASDKPLHVHHCIYAQGRPPWDYSHNTLMALCGECHELRGQLDFIIRAASAIQNRFSTLAEMVDRAKSLNATIETIPGYTAPK